MHFARLILLVLLVHALGAAEPPLNSVPGVPMTVVVGQGAGAVAYVVNPDGTMVLGPKQCLVPDGNVTIAKPVVDSAEVQLVNPAYEKITYPPNLVRIHKVPFDGTRRVIKWEKEMGSLDKFGYMPHERVTTQTHHFLQVDDAGKEVEAFWDSSLPEDPEPKSEHVTKAYDGPPSSLDAPALTTSTLSIDHGVAMEPACPGMGHSDALSWLDSAIVLVIALTLTTSLAFAVFSYLKGRK